MKLSLPNAITSKVGIASLKMQKHSPTLLFGGGIVLGVATVVTACQATLKVEGTLEQHRQHVEWAKDEKNKVEDPKREVALAYAVTTRKLVKLYAPSAVLGFASVACLTQSHRILTSRNAGLTAAYAAVDKAYTEYRERVADEFGEDKEREIHRAVVESTEKVTKKDGSTKDVKVKKSTGGGSGYARLFDEHNKNWDSNADYRTGFLRLSQNQLNDQLNAKGYLFLNDVYDQLGFERTKAGQTVGWLSDKFKESKDGYVDFGVFSDRSMQEFYNFNKYGDAIWLDFNVDGPIMDYLDRI